MQNSNKGNNIKQDDLLKGNNTNQDDLLKGNKKEYDLKYIKQQITDLYIDNKENTKSGIINEEEYDPKDITQRIDHSDNANKKNTDSDIINKEKNNLGHLKQRIADKEIFDSEKIGIDALDSAKQNLNEGDAKILEKSIQDNLQKSAPSLPRDDLVELEASLVFVDQSQYKAQDLSRVYSLSEQKDRPSSEFRSRSARKASSCLPKRLPKPCTIS